MGERAWRIDVDGIVQGVGFRPSVYRIAMDLHLKGYVYNHEKGVTIVLEGTEEKLNRFQDRLRSDLPPAATIWNLAIREIESPGLASFEIRESAHMGEIRRPVIPPDLALCDDCRRELYDPEDRRYLYPFINCTNCGPRFTIIRDLPYDRPATTMSNFPMCEECRSEYEDPVNRRFHAQPVACPKCGPSLAFLDGEGKELSPPVTGEISSGDMGPDDGIGRPRNVENQRNWDAIGGAVQLLREGGILAVKGLGGYHLACDATNEESVALLRERKRRIARPFAVMFPSRESVREYLDPSAEELQLLVSPAAPIVLIQVRSPSDLEPSMDSSAAPSIGSSVAFSHAHSIAPSIAPSVAPGLSRVGAMLPYTPLHEILLRLFGKPLVMTSANRSDEPMAFRDGDAMETLRGLVDGFLVHNRKIHMRTDDSVVRLTHNGLQFLRRSRGFAPGPVKLPMEFSRTVLAAGGDLKNAFCIATGQEAILSHHHGDLEHLSALHAYRESLEHLLRLYRLEPEIIACDMHPGFQSTMAVREIFSGLDAKGAIIPVQHHHAHIISCAVENGYRGPVIGVALDGTGYGEDGTIRGGEILIADEGGYLREAWLRRLALPGGEKAIREVWRIAASALLDGGLSHEEISALLCNTIRPALFPVSVSSSSSAVSSSHPFLSSSPSPPSPSRSDMDIIIRMVEKGLNSPMVSSCGRLFDAFAVIAGGPHSVSYEGEAAILLEEALRSSAAPMPRDAGRVDASGVGRGANGSGNGGPNRGEIDSLLQQVSSGFHLREGSPAEIDWRQALASGARASLSGAGARELSVAFHNGLADVLAASVMRSSKRTGIKTVALSGGCFYNEYLEGRLSGLLVAGGLRVLLHTKLPPGDGGIALGQAVIARSIAQGEKSCVLQYR